MRDKYPEREIIYTCEPGGTDISEVIRNIVQVREFEEEMDFMCETYLYAVSRAQSLRQVVMPVLKNDGIVVADRSFITSIAYQGFSRELGFDKVWEVNKAAVNGIFPDVVFYINVPAKLGLSRCFDKEGDKFERKTCDFFEKAIAGYEEIEKSELLSDAWVEIDGTSLMHEVFTEIINKLCL